jgi:hypothetical protein
MSRRTRRCRGRLNRARARRTPRQGASGARLLRPPGLTVSRGIRRGGLSGGGRGARRAVRQEAAPDLSRCQPACPRSSSRQRRRLFGRRTAVLCHAAHSQPAIRARGAQLKSAAHDALPYNRNRPFSENSQVLADASTTRSSSASDRRRRYDRGPNVAAKHPHRTASRNERGYLSCPSCSQTGAGSEIGEPCRIRARTRR